MKTIEVREGTLDSVPVYFEQTAERRVNGQFHNTRVWSRNGKDPVRLGYTWKDDDELEELPLVELSSSVWVYR